MKLVAYLTDEHCIVLDADKHIDKARSLAQSICRDGVFMRSADGSETYYPPNKIIKVQILPDELFDQLEKTGTIKRDTKGPHESNRLLTSPRNA